MNAEYFGNLPRYVQLPMHQEQTIFTLHFWDICFLDSVMAEEEALASFCISLPSGQSTTISLPASSTLAALKEAAQETFRKGWLRLATADGRLLSDPQQQKWIKNCLPFALLTSEHTLFVFYFRDVCMAGTVLQCIVTCVWAHGVVCVTRCNVLLSKSVLL